MMYGLFLPEKNNVMMYDLFLPEKNMRMAMLMAQQFVASRENVCSRGLNAKMAIAANMIDIREQPCNSSGSPEN